MDQRGRLNHLPTSRREVSDGKTRTLSCEMALTMVQLAFAVTCSFTWAFFWRAHTILKKFSVLGLPRGANIRCRLLLGFLSVEANFSNPRIRPMS